MKTKAFFCCLLLTCGIGRILADLPKISQDDLINLVQANENLVQAYQAEYLLQYGGISSENVFTADVNIECIYAYDTGQGHHYLYQKWLNHSSGDQMETKYAFDGTIGTVLNLKMPGSPSNTYGTIMNKSPQEIAAQNADKPLWNSCGYFSRYNSDTLSDALKMAKNVKIEPDGDNTYKVTFDLTGEKASTVDPRNGKAISYTKDGRFIVWFSEQYGFMPRKIAVLNGPAHRGGKIKEFTELSDFREISNGVWLPHKIDMRANVGQRSSSMTIKEITINEKVEVVSKLKFPPKTFVKDEVLGIEYQVGLSDEYIISEMDRSVDIINSIKKSDDVSLPDFNSNSDDLKATEQINLNENMRRSSPVASATWKHGLFIVGGCVLLGAIMFLLDKNKKSNAS